MYPTFAEYRNQLRLADAEEAKYRDVRPLMQTLQLFANTNPRLRGHILTRQTAVSSRPWRLEAPDDSIVETAVQDLRKTIATLLQTTITLPLYGVFAVKLQWGLTDRWRPQILTVYRPDQIERYDDTSVAILSSDNNRQIIDPDDTAYLAAFQHGQRGGILRAIGHLEIIRYDITLEWANYARKLKGIIQGIDRGADDKERSLAEEALRTALLHNYLITSDLIDFRFHQIASASSSAAFRDLLEMINNSIAIAILGQANTPELPKRGGSRAALQVQQMISADIALQDVRAATDIINHLLLHYYRLNYDRNADTSPIQFQFTEVAAVDLAEIADTLAAIASVTDVSAEAQLLLEHIRSKLQ